jgi:hypothetical protein
MQGCGSGFSDFMDPDPYRIGNQDPDLGANKLRNFSEKNALFSYYKKNIPPKRYKIALLFEKKFDE